MASHCTYIALASHHQRASAAALPLLIGHRERIATSTAAIRANAATARQISTPIIIATLSTAGCFVALSCRNSDGRVERHSPVGIAANNEQSSINKVAIVTTDTGAVMFAAMSAIASASASVATSADADTIRAIVLMQRCPYSVLLTRYRRRQGRCRR